jgi:hypothetical protein
MRPARFAANVAPPPPGPVLVSDPVGNPADARPAEDGVAPARRGPRKCMFRLPVEEAAFFRQHSTASMRKLLIEWVARFGAHVPGAADRFNEHRAALGLPPVPPAARRDEGELVSVQLSLQPAEVEAIDRLAAERHLTRSAFLTEVVRAARTALQNTHR